MKRSIALFVGLLLFPTNASAQTASEQNVASPVVQNKDVAKPAQNDVQMVHATGRAKFDFLAAFEGPVGRMGKGRDGRLSDMLGPRVRLGGDLGVFLSPRWRVSGRLNLIYGVEGSDFDGICKAGREASGESSSCMSYGVGIEAHVRHDFRRAAAPLSPRPWVSYGFGYERVWMIGSTAGSETSLGHFEGDFSSINFAIPALGVDWAFEHNFSVGLFLHAGLGHYFDRSASARVGIEPEVQGDFGGSTIHAWIGGGMRLGRF